jgi:hypothetical protein
MWKQKKPAGGGNPAGFSFRAGRRMALLET